MPHLPLLPLMMQDLAVTTADHWSRSRHRITATQSRLLHLAGDILPR
jgi:hypothetical protein